MGVRLTTEQVIIRDWTVDDAEAALAIYGSPDIAPWLTPLMDGVSGLAAMRSALRAWQEAQQNLPAPHGRWAVQRRSDNAVVGGLGIGLLPPNNDDLGLSWHLSPEALGQDYATEAARALIAWAFTQDADELFAVARPTDPGAMATAERTGLQWVGETTKYYGLSLQVYRIRPSDLLDWPPSPGAAQAGLGDFIGVTR